MGSSSRITNQTPDLVLWTGLLLHFLGTALSASERGLVTDINDPAFIDECVRTHNTLRSAVSPSASNMLYMSWDETLAKSARAWATACRFSHNPLLRSPGKLHPLFSPVGENVWVGSTQSFSPGKAIEMWDSEKAHYTYTSGECTKTCGHYTQVVWADSYKVGCAAHTCSSMEEFPSGERATVFVCNYGHTGNRKGIPPYKNGLACTACTNELCEQNLCRNLTRDKQRSYSWIPDWDTGNIGPTSDSSTWWSTSLLALGELTTLILLFLL